MEIDKIKN